MDSTEVPPESVTGMLHQWSGGDRDVLHRLIPTVYSELHRIAHRCLARERSGHTLSTTALVHEAYVRLQSQSGIDFQNSTHFYAIAARSMRQILVDYARKLATAKRDHDKVALTVEMPDSVTPLGIVDLIDLDDALERLGAFDVRLSQIVELRFFAGMSIEETAGILETSPAGVKRDWTIARAWLFHQIGQDRLERPAEGGPL